MLRLGLAFAGFDAKTAESQAKPRKLGATRDRQESQ
jgi:hypothetical protein